MVQKFTALILLFTALFASFPAVAHAEEKLPSVSAKSAILINADTGAVLYAKNEKERLPMASTTKIMTALIALETAALDDRCVTITDEMVRVEGSSMGLQAGDQLSLTSLAAGMLVVSGNDAANSVAIAISGSKEDFAEKMNRRAKDIGMNDTHFVTPSGLDDEAHYSTAYDMALLATIALANPDFAEIVKEKKYTIPYISPEQSRRFSNHNRLLSMYEGCIGVKTGFTKKSGRCLVSAAERDGIRLVAVTLNAPDDWNDHQTMFNYGFSILESVALDDSGCTFAIPAVGAVEQTLTVKGAQGNTLSLTREDAAALTRTVELPRFFYAPVKDGARVGQITYRLKGEVVATTDLIAASSLTPVLHEKSLWEKIVDYFKSLL
ncbi:D-alanyl-D-alanine carboxypeptidase [Hydrogeniiclostridium mannosilyticum]|uniref:serine-type D-Ala-D-Ala carboxypeptidase n=1 Tax=Hydrogeniiclostridium mannosilyticum TaxID=2764322 RepID=A0A328UCG4_9FIRM|nr:D-alanyl-D-alanine carboxypeptidase family protein [Hydrogeniiclostridium mannosilyticum]RAQ28494.1 D-alanyl-D-alanine carboxypeptidase [Hydrogeniiclostridium mannosilyticum]